jgi:hypothetical protein
MVKFHQKPDLYRKVQSARNADSATGRVSDYRNSQIANVCNHLMDHHKYERVVYQNGIQGFQSFG